MQNFSLKEKIHMANAHLVSLRSKCVSWKVGAVIVKDDRPVSIGYNGTPAGHTNCSDIFGQNVQPQIWDENKKLTIDGRSAHHAWSLENEIHAEINAILFAAKNTISIDKSDLYVTVSPCKDCAKAITQSGIKKVYYDILYDKNGNTWDSILTKSGIEVVQLNLDWDEIYTMLQQK